MLARFSGWGGLSALFDTRTDTYKHERETLQSLVDEAAYKQALQSTANAHYTQPTIARLLWQSLQSLGLAEGARVVEPGCGVGMFIGTAPAAVRMVGVEIDPTPAAIAARLYPNADIRAQSYTDTDLDEDGYFDAAIGNVPFGNYRPYDPVYNPGNHTIHNYFISKALAQVRPGGIVAVLTSRYTMDAKNPGIRRELYARADLVGAIRLPAGTHEAMAGTDVISDILIFRRREKNDEPRPFDWEYTHPLKTGEGEFPVNEYFHTHPGRVLGEWEETTNQYGAALSVASNLDTLEGSVRFIHEAKNNPEKEELFRDCREGRVAVLIGSTQKMGTGTNVQKRCIATHHLDVPWRPTDITQRDGRMVRQGNENPEVYNYRYVVTGSFSAYMWQTNERKARSIAQIMTNKTGTRSVEDVSPEEMEAGRAKAIATGNPLLLEKCEVDATLQKYRALHSSWQRTRNRAIDDTRTLDLRIRASEKTIATLEDLQSYIRDTSGDKFSVRIERGVFTERAAAAQALSRAVSARISPYIIENVRRTGGTYSVPQGVRIELGGIELDVARVEADSRMGVVSDVSIIFTPVDLKDVRYGPRAGIPLSILQRGQSGLIQRLENLVASLPQRLDEEKENLAFLREEAQSARELSTKEFPHEAEYAAVRTRSKEITLALEDQGDAKAHREQEARFREGIKYEEHEGFFEGLATWPRIPLPPKPTPIDAIDNWEALPTVARYESREYTWEVLGIVAGNQNGQALTRLTSNAQTHLFVADLLELEAMADPLTHAPGTVAQPLVHRTPLTPPEDAERGEHSAVDERAENEERDTGDDAAVSGESTTPAVGTGTADVATHTGEEQSVDVMRPSIPTLYDGIERTALTEAAPGVFIAKYGEQVVTFLDEARNQQVGVPYQRLFPEPGEPALYAYPDLDIAQTGNLAGSGQVARALLLDSRQDAAYLDEYAPGWRADVDEPDVPDVRDLDTADTDDVSSEESVNVRYVPPIYKGETPERVEVLAPGIETATYESAGTIVFLDPEVDALLPSRYRASLFAYPGSETSAAYREDRPREAHLRGAAQLVRALFLGSREDARYCHQVDPTWNDDASEVRAQYRAYCAANYERQAAAPIFTAVSRAVNAARTAGARGASDPREHSDALM